MKLHPLSLVLPSLCCVLIAVGGTDGTFVPGRCLCPQTRRGVREPFRDLAVYEKSPTCHSVTVIVTLRRNGQLVCLDPGAPLGKQLIRCWRRARKLGRDAKLCVRRRRRAGGRRRSAKGTRRHSRRQSPPGSK